MRPSRGRVVMMRFVGLNAALVLVGMSCWILQDYLYVRGGQDDSSWLASDWLLAPPLLAVVVMNSLLLEGTRVQKTPLVALAAAVYVACMVVFVGTVGLKLHFEFGGRL